MAVQFTQRAFRDSNTRHEVRSGQIGGQFATTTVDDIQFDLWKRWHRVPELVRHFWRRWLQEWLPSLGARTKLHREHRDLQVGEVVLVVSPDTALGNWPLVRVVEVYPGIAAGC